MMKKSEAVVIHVRRGDYLSEKNRGIYELCDMKYYDSAIDKVKKNVKNPLFFVFSDDIGWCRKSFDKSEKIVFVDDSLNTDIDDFTLMLQGKHFIIANSTFSWWAAWLNTVPNKIVISPEKWFIDAKMNQLVNNIIPIEWKKI
jgi:hypothetical protein